tara:strand:- start:920 stop:1567 length:648 start_codon:yes stop_codon:yes gene_type:complete
MKNDYGSGEKKISIPPTLLFSLFGAHPDVRYTTTSDLKPGESLYLVGESKQELGASELAFMLRERGDAEGIGGEVPQLPEPEKNLSAYKALTKAIQSGIVRTAHDCSEGGVAIAIAEMCIGGRCGAAIDVDGPGEADLWGRLWGESLGRIIVGVKQQNRAEFLSAMKGNSLTYMGETTDGDNLSIWDGDDLIIDANVDEMVSSWKGSLDMTGGDQ